MFQGRRLIPVPVTAAVFRAPGQTPIVFEVMVFSTTGVLKVEDLTVSGFVMQARRNIPTAPHPSETIRLVKAFLAITCAMERERLTEYAEHLAAEHEKFEYIEVATDNNDQEV